MRQCEANTDLDRVLVSAMHNRDILPEEPWRYSKRMREFNGAQDLSIQEWDVLDGDRGGCFFYTDYSLSSIKASDIFHKGRYGVQDTIEFSSARCAV